jgi:hypothetical protein
VQRCNDRTDPPSSTGTGRDRLIFPDDLGNVLRRLRTCDFPFCPLVAEYTGAAVERASSRAGVAPAEVQRLSRRTVTTIEQGEKAARKCKSICTSFICSHRGRMGVISVLERSALWWIVELDGICHRIGHSIHPVSQTNFSYVGDVEVPSGSANVFKFQLNAESNVSFVLAASDLSYTPGLGGFLWTDRKTGQLLRVEANATELVSTFPIVSHYSATNYGDVPIFWHRNVLASNSV